jgi:hypothetical protein
MINLSGLGAEIIRPERFGRAKKENPPKSWTPGDNLVYSWL